MYWAPKSAISVEKGVGFFFASQIREKRMFSKLGYEHGIPFGRGRGWGIILGNSLVITNRRRTSDLTKGGQDPCDIFCAHTPITNNFNWH